MKITPANVKKVISVTTAIYWTLVGLACWSDIRSGDWMNKGGWWIAVLLFTGTCGPAFWAMVAPVTIRAWRLNPLPRSLPALAKGLWYVSTIPMVLLCFGLFCRLIYYRITE